MGYICVPCGKRWDPGHVCAEQLGLGPTVLVTNSQAEAQATFDAVKRELDKMPSFGELDHRMRRRPWRL